MRHGQPKLFKSAVSGLPYDAEVEWLQNNNKSYIDTGIKLNQATDSMGCRFQPVSASATYCIFCGTRQGAYYSLNFSNNHVCFDYQSGGYLGTIQPENRNGLHTWECRVDETANTASLFRDGKLITTRQRYRKATSANAWVFVANDEYRSLYGRVSEFWITRSGKYLIHLIAVRFTNELGQSEGAMYDKVSGRLFRNSGTGSFIIGADKTKETVHGAPKNTVKPYDVEVEYLQSTGTQWIDTGYVPNNSSGFKITVNSSTTGGNYIPFGHRQDSGNTRWWINFDGTFEMSWNTWTSVSGYSKNRWYEIEFNWLNSRDGKIDGVKKYTISSTLATHTGTAKMFRAGQGDSSTVNPFLGKISHVLISEGENIVRDFIPVRFLNEQGQQEGAMYDKVSGSLFRNKGTGDFVVGPDKT